MTSYKNNFDPSRQKPNKTSYKNNFDPSRQKPNNNKHRIIVPKQTWIPPYKGYWMLYRPFAYDVWMEIRRYRDENVLWVCGSRGSLEINYRTFSYYSKLTIADHDLRLRRIHGMSSDEYLEMSPEAQYGIAETLTNFYFLFKGILANCPVWASDSPNNIGLEGQVDTDSYNANKDTNKDKDKDKDIDDNSYKGLRFCYKKTMEDWEHEIFDHELLHRPMEESETDKWNYLNSLPSQEGEYVYKGIHDDFFINLVKNSRKLKAYYKRIQKKNKK
jgi:hypothetical protein